jgi:hypothetical protein
MREIGRWRRWLAACAIGALVAPCRAHEVPAISGMRAHVDPETGRRVPEAAVPETPRALPAPPRAVETPAPGGGMMLDVRGRFMSEVVATVEPDGRVRIDCVDAGAIRE